MTNKIEKTATDDFMFEALRAANQMRQSEGVFTKNCENPERMDTLEFRALEICNEAGEIADAVKKYIRDGDVSSEDILDEIADVVISCDLMATTMNVRLSEIVKRKFNKTSVKVNSVVRLDEDNNISASEELIEMHLQNRRGVDE